MGKAKKTRKFAEVKRLLSPKDRECVLCPSADSCYCLLPPFLMMSACLQSTETEAKTAKAKEGARGSPCVSSAANPRQGGDTTALRAQDHHTLSPHTLTFKPHVYCIPIAGTRCPLHCSSPTTLSWGPHTKCWLTPTSSTFQSRTRCGRSWNTPRCHVRPGHNGIHLLAPAVRS